MNYIGCLPKIAENPTKQEMLESIAATPPDASGLICILMAHGKAGAVLFDDSFTTVQEIVSAMDCSKLRGKPKMLIIQACRGSVKERMKTNSERETCNQPFEIKCPDMLAIFSTFHGGLSARNVMIPSFAKAIKNSEPGADVCDVYLRTTNGIMKSEPDQVPEMRTTLRYKLCLGQFKEVYK